MTTETLKTPDWLHRRWNDIIKAAIGEIGGWAQRYSHGFIQPDEGDFPKECPDEVPLWNQSQDLDISWVDWPHKELYVEIREIGDTGLVTEKHDPLDIQYPEFHFGTYAVFRITKQELDWMNEGYEDEAGSENERILEDGDHRIVVYML